MNNKVSDSAPVDPNAILQNLKAAELKLVLAPIYAFLTAAQQPGANIATIVQGIKVVELEELAQVPAIEAVGIQNIAAALQAKLQAYEASLTASSGGGASA